MKDNLNRNLSFRKISYNIMPCKTCRFYHNGITDTFTCQNWNFCKKFKVDIPDQFLRYHDIDDHVGVHFICDSYVGEK